MQLVIYRRVSTEEQGRSKNGLEAQAAALEAFVQAGGHTVLGDFCEVASGGLGPADRPVLRQALALARQHRATLLVSKLDRLSRSVEYVAHLMNTGALFATVEDGLDCPPLMLHLKAMLGEHERKVIGQRTRDALAAKKARGEPLGAQTHKRPGAGLQEARQAAAQVHKAQADGFAYRLAPALRTMRGQGLTLQAMADRLNAEGTPTARGGVWSAPSVCNLLKRLDRQG